MKFIISSSTMTTTTTAIILLLATGIGTVLAKCPKDNIHIVSCCCLGFNTTGIFNKWKSGVYTMIKFCGVKRYYDAEGYYDTVNGGGGWLVVQRR